MLVLGLLASCGGDFKTDYEYPVARGVSDYWHLQDVVVDVPEQLEVSEANLFAPPGDIVWRGEALGDRKEQVTRILEEGLQEAGSSLIGGRPVMLKARLERFHALSERARRHLNFSGMHSIAFVIDVIDMRTGVKMSHRDLIKADLPAYVGRAAREADERGETQRVRIVKHIGDVTKAWLNQAPDMRQRYSRIGL